MLPVHGTVRIPGRGTKIQDAVWCGQKIFLRFLKDRSWIQQARRGPRILHFQQASRDAGPETTFRGPGTFHPLGDERLWSLQTGREESSLHSSCSSLHEDETGVAITEQGFAQSPPALHRWRAALQGLGRVGGWLTSDQAWAAKKPLASPTIPRGFCSHS